MNRPFLLIKNSTGFYTRSGLLYAGVDGRLTTQGYTGDSTRQKFTQKERDNETGFDYFGARYFASTQGRFTSADEPFNDQEEDVPQSWNLYAYVRNNPLRFIDPSGEAHWQLESDGQLHYVGDNEGEYDKDLNATWDGAKWNFLENNGQTNAIVAPQEEVSSMAMNAGALTFTLSPPPVKAAIAIAAAAAAVGLRFSPRAKL